LIFAVNDIQHISHADQIVKIAREVFGRAMILYKKSPATRMLTVRWKKSGVSAIVRSPESS
jgi:hypothetical protein